MTRGLDRLFDGASGLPEAEREGWLRSQTGDSRTIGEVLALLRADAEADSFLELPPIEAIANAAAELETEAAAAKPNRVGAYSIERVLGRGGMGEVYLAHRESEDFDQRVALKLLHGVPTRALVTRFARERRVLASLAHPNIAPLIDGGETEQGTPYLVMPYVEGMPIDAHCESRGLGPREIVELILPVVDAVSHAHRRLVVHRDLKPANVLVTEDGRPVVLDFGIAKVLGDAGPDATATEQNMLTPRYASPEQVRGEPVSTATDVFSLGVMLYELLSGAHPWGRDDVNAVELARRICEVNPPSPSRARAERSVDARSSSRRVLWPDLDAVVMTAMRKEPDRRYLTVSELAEDLRRTLDGRAVTAQPDTVTYRARRFVRRHRLAVTLAGIALASMIGGTAISSWQAAGASAASHRYLDQLDQTQVRSAQLRDLATTLIFDVYDSVAPLDGANTARMTLVANGITYLDDLAEQLEDDPDLATDLVGAYVRLADVQGLRTIGSIGDTPGAFESSRKALAIAEALQTMPDAPADAPVLLAMAQRAQGDLLRSVGRFDDALAAYSTGLDAARTALMQTDGSPRTHRFAIGLALQRGALERRIGRPDDAERSYEMAMGWIRRVLDDDPTHVETRRDFGIGLRRLGDLLLAEGRVDEAAQMFREGLDVFRDLLDAEPANRQHESSVAIQLERLGDCALRLDDAAAARSYYDASYQIVSEESRRNPGDVLALERLSIALEKLADASVAAGAFSEAAAYAERAVSLAVRVATLDPDNRAARLDALYIRGKAARISNRAGLAASDEFAAVAAEAGEISRASPADAYAADIEVSALAALVRIDPTQSAQLRDVLARHAPRFARLRWFEEARAAAAEAEATVGGADGPGT